MSATGQHPPVLSLARIACVVLNCQVSAAAPRVSVTGAHDDAPIDHTATFRTSHSHPLLLSVESAALLGLGPKENVHVGHHLSALVGGLHFAFYDPFMIRHVHATHCKINHIDNFIGGAIDGGFRTVHARHVIGLENDTFSDFISGVSGLLDTLRRWPTVWVMIMGAGVVVHLVLHLLVHIVLHLMVHRIGIGGWVLFTTVRGPAGGQEQGSHHNAEAEPGQPSRCCHVLSLSIARHWTVLVGHAPRTQRGPATRALLPLVTRAVAGQSGKSSIEVYPIGV